MIIKALHVQNFRSIKDETLECDKLTALVGPNGAGKSSFLKALDMFYTVAASYKEDDYYAKDTAKDILITITFSELTGEELKLFQKYVEKGELTVEKEIKWPSGRGSQKYYGTSLQNPEFDEFRKAQSAKERKEAYDKLLTSSKYSQLPKWTKQDDATRSLKEWEQSNLDICTRQRDEGQFFGFKEVGEAHLERYTKFLLIPAVRDASEDAAEGRGRVLSEIMDLVVRSVLAQREDVKKLQEDTQKKYEEIMEPSNLIELKTLEDSLTDTLKTYVPDTQVNLTWLKAENIEIPMPKADIKLVEDEYPSPVECTGHGLQRALILTMLQHLAVAQAPMQESGDKGQLVTDNAPQAEPESKAKITAIPSLILGIEEPELYQHPNRQRHLSKILFKLATGSIKGVAAQTQVIYSTHSPLFVDIERFKHLRILRKKLAENDKPKQTKVFQTNLDEIVKIIEKADGKPEGTYTGETLEPRLKTLMTPWMNEGFFADVAVLVEGEEDRAAILGTASALGHDFESIGISVIPCMGKNSIDRPTAIFRELEIPVYAIWDSDKGGKDSKPEENHRLLRLFSQEIEDWPEKITPSFACFEKTLQFKLQDELGKEFFDIAIESCLKKYSITRKDQAFKNPIIIQEILTKAKTESRKSVTLEQIVENIVALKKSTEASEKTHA